MLWRSLPSILFAVCLVASHAALNVTLYGNTALSEPVLETREITPAEISFSSQNGVFSAEVTGTITFPRPGLYNFSCEFNATTMAFLWVDGHLLCQDGNAYAVDAGSTDNPLPIRRVLTYAFRAHIYFSPNATDVRPPPPASQSAFDTSSISSASMHRTPTKQNISVAIRWSVDGGELLSIPDNAFSPALPKAEQMRDALQRNASAGWGNMLHQNMLTFTNLPSGAALTTVLCQISSGRCLDVAVPDGVRSQGVAAVRVGPYASDRSYGQFYFGADARTPLPFGNLSMEFSAGAKGLRLIAAPQGCDKVNCSDLTIRVNGRYLWYRAGDVGVSSREIHFAPAGLTATRVFVSSRGLVHGADLSLSLGNGAVAFSTFGAETLDVVQGFVGNARSLHETKMRARFEDAEMAEVATAVEAAAMWTMISTPAENGFGVLMPVSRSWNRVPRSNPDFSYSIFDWDNLFASLLAGLVSKDIAYSNVIQSFKSKTAEGYLANCAGGGYKDQDRTEPPVGGKVLLSLYQRYQDKWLVELLFDDVLDWSDWFLRQRLLPPVGLIALGSWNERTGQPGVMQTARYESGLDNSPMYDGEFFNTTTGLMEMYDVGMSSMFVQEAYALAELADAIGRPEAHLLRARGDRIRDLIRAHLWDESQQIYANRFSNGTFCTRITPTSFYAMQAGAPSDDQAKTMVKEWLLASERFCIAPDGDFKGNTDDCYWGLPSVQASDAAFPPLGYWRGYIWGPMGILTYWSLENYAHVPEIARAKAAMTKQLAALMLSQWRAHRHICENYGPHKNSTECTGTQFYHWGALNGLVLLLQNGHWESKSDAASTRLLQV